MSNVTLTMVRVQSLTSGDLQIAALCRQLTTSSVTAPSTEPHKEREGLDDLDPEMRVWLEDIVVPF